jgi:hypothetical protein
MKFYPGYLRLAAIILAAALCYPGVRPTLGQSKDPLIGEWVLNLGKSDFMPDNPPQKRTMTFAAKDNGINCVIRTVISGGLDNGSVSESDFTARYDGKDYDISESILDTISLKRIDANTIERKGKVHGAVVETATMKLSENGKVLTVTTKGSIGGIDYSSTQVFDRR